MTIPVGKPGKGKDVEAGGKQGLQKAPPPKGWAQKLIDSFKKK